MTEPTEVNTETPVAVPDPTRVRVSITLDTATTYPNIICSHPLPATKKVWMHLEKKAQAKVKKLYRWGWENLRDTIQSTRSFITFETWANAIAECIIHDLANQNGASVDAPISGSGYLALGETLYKLHPVGLLPQTRALAITRKRVFEKVQAEAKVLKEESEEASKAIISSAVRTRREAEEIKRQAEQESRNIPPIWLLNSGFPIKWNDGRYLFEVQLRISVVLYGLDLEFNSGTYTWIANLGYPAKIWHLWVPFSTGGKYVITSIHTDKNEPILPHIKQSGSCMELAGAPVALNSVDDLFTLKESIEHCCSRIQLNSLYGGFNNWDLFKDSIPVELFKALKGETFTGFSERSGSEKLALTATHGGATFESYGEETSRTWSPATPIDTEPEDLEEVLIVGPALPPDPVLPPEVTTADLAEVLEPETRDEWNTQTTPTT